MTHHHLTRSWLARGILALLAAGAALLPSRQEAAAGPDELVAIVSKDVPVTSLNRDELRNMFLGVRTSWPGGGRIVCVNAVTGSRARDLFRAHVLHMTADEEQRYWEEQKVQGKAQEPASFANTVKAVFRLKGSVSYALRSEVKGDVVRIVGTL